MVKRTRSAIDLYSGVGGWSLGLKLAGIAAEHSFDHWAIANRTNQINNGHEVHLVDVRALSPAQLPSDTEFVVGSPPCTQFSYSNRGGSGNVQDGLKDIIQFLTIVDYLKPRAWAMENVPRVAGIIETELKPGGVLEPFKHLNIQTHIINMEDFGLPQRRRRCICGNFDFDLLKSYVDDQSALTLGDVLVALGGPKIVDPIWGISTDRDCLIDHEHEAPLSAEEEKINRASKVNHPVYNKMEFPDRLDRSGRTVTATCTRVSRESIIVRPQASEALRRLTLRERAVLQSFPISFQFYGKTSAQKQKMIGNAFPPLMAFFIAQAMLGVRNARRMAPHVAIERFNPPREAPPQTPPSDPPRKYPPSRKFRFAIPSLQLKSGVGFEFSNSIEGDKIDWSVRLYFGNSKNIHSLNMGAASFNKLIGKLDVAAAKQVKAELQILATYLKSVDLVRLQDVWSHRGPGGTRPTDILDRLTEAGVTMSSLLQLQSDSRSAAMIQNALEFEFGAKYYEITGTAKLVRNERLVLAGLLIGSMTNSILSAADTHSGQDGIKLVGVR
jgi:DNA (cytosine-5)-methyltransferase 1